MMASVVKNPIIRLNISRLATHRKFAVIENYNRQLSTSFPRYNDDKKGSGDNKKTNRSPQNDKSSSKAEGARKKLHQLLMETRNPKMTREKTPENVSDKSSASKKIKLAKPRLKKLGDYSEKENIGGLDPEMVYAAHRVATSSAALDIDERGDNTDNDDREDKRQIKVRKIESALLKRLKAVNVETEEAKANSEVSNLKNLSSLFKNIEVLHLQLIRTIIFYDLVKKGREI